ncbi:MAG: Peptidyl-tRNA hydrolase [Candidatus Woesebacteria bacterium GW2011_GWB1_45_5]|uniref:Peptidyl-tRNA hydrolase n=1 Tax=Candidatus Woesebacteria bacterium GW2011_GWB1_45_5 TaxID=1618581 RepID=A0A0G1MP07_9BACT|nr:MAG: Peptidyl-tRNA hydrolase [Candidatus Woesebacteria bacterium GW2011_GWB1_45_5]
MDMKLIIGLGNPGTEYSNTRHNAGHLFIEELQKNKLSGGFVIKKPDTFMNESGEFVKNLVDKYKTDLTDLYIVHDDLDILLGSYKVQLGKGPKDHNGVASVDKELGSDAYWHVRIGIDKRDPENKVLGEEYVLQNFTDEEREVLDRVIKEVCKKLATL